MTDKMDKEEKAKIAAGLQDIVITEQDICYIDGQNGRVIYRGYDINDLARNSTFEEVCYLLWHGDLPTSEQLDELNNQLFEAMTLPPEIYEILRALPKNAEPMRVLEVAVAALGMVDPEANDEAEASNQHKALRLTAQLPVITTAWHRIRNDQEPIAATKGKSLAYNFLKMLFGDEPDEYAVDTLDAALVLHADHELNASTFAARVTAATLSDFHSAIVSAIGTLKGPLHGGANEAVMVMLEEIGEPENVESWLENYLEQGNKVMGFGHRVYRTKDPRAKILEVMSEELGKRTGQTKWFEMSRRVEAAFQPQVAAKGIYPNVDFFSASAYHVMGIPRDLFTPIFACSRISGWSAHLLEQYADNRLIRPTSDYIGPTDLKWKPIDERGS